MVVTDIFKPRVDAYEPPMPLNADLKNGNFSTWFLPVPASVTLLPTPGMDFTTEIKNGTYPY